LALTTSLARIVLLYREHVDQNTPNNKKSIVDLWTEELIDEIRMKVQTKYIPLPDYRPILLSN
jgi:hypothetical protein